jgi:hypothetical protein
VLLCGADRYAEHVRRRWYIEAVGIRSQPHNVDDDLRYDD